ncbi:YxeA family protein [Staphylococcus gallinarum]|uniref:YxeA family protein n=1 Tax=Staphylococcus gallinarum TaxID=1293 RepID=UPI001E657349|nr:YxeA family protein [Staphylococcus gallinarum]MCD8871449.1 YxeA family protein [Staphylococcus gallinarum]MCW0986314.1 YxeA family protein [Staphylococcus gallinarum]
MRLLYKLILPILLLFVFIFLALFGWKLYAENHQDNNKVRDYAKFNPLIHNEYYYVKIQQPIKKNVNYADNGQKFISYTYQQTSANHQGNTKEIKFNSFNEHKLKSNHYLKLEIRLGDTQSYKEVQKQQVPKAALDKIDN